MQIAKATTLASSPPASVHCTERMIGRARSIPRPPRRPTHQRAVTLRQHDIGQPQEDRRGVDRQARQRALRDERRIMVEREKDVGRPRRNRQGRHQRADHGARALGDEGGRHHEGRGDRHAQGEHEEEGEFGGHSSVVPAKAGTHNHGCPCGAKAVEQLSRNEGPRRMGPGLRRDDDDELTPASSTPKPSGRS